MFECCDNPAYLCRFPTELLIYIFQYLSAKNLTLCRAVCRRWKEVIDRVARDDILWERHCEKDFKTLSLEAKEKSNSCRLWFDIYRSLTLWGRLADATEFRDEFCHCTALVDEILNLFVLFNGEIAVHKRASVAFYDISTLELSKREPVHGEFNQYVEYDDIRIVLSNQLQLNVFRKLKHCESSGNGVIQKTFHRIKYFVIHDRYIFFVNCDNDVFHCSFDDQLTVFQYNSNFPESVVALSFYNGCLNMLTFERNMYCYQENMFVKLFDLESKKDNLMDFLWQYRFIENIDWRAFYVWMACLRVRVPDGMLRYICRIKVYGDIFFIGSTHGTVLIYYKPYVNGHLDLFSHKPVKQYRFVERNDIPVLTLPPIVNIDVVEIKGGHKVLVVMPKKVVVITYIHNFEVAKSKAVMLYVSPGPVVLKKNS